MSRELLGGPRDGQVFAVDPRLPDIRIPVVDRPTLDDFTTSLAPQVSFRPAVYRRQEVMAAGPHPCIRGLYVELRATGYVHDSLPPEWPPIVAMVANRGDRTVRVGPDWHAAVAEFEHARQAGLDVDVPAVLWADTAVHR